MTERRVEMESESPPSVHVGITIDGRIVLGVTHGGSKAVHWNAEVSQARALFEAGLHLCDAVERQSDD